MSTRAIAPILGVSQKTVVKDMQVIPQVSPASPETEHGLPTTDRIVGVTGVGALSAFRSIDRKAVPSPTRAGTPDRLDGGVRQTYRLTRA